MNETVMNELARVLSGINNGVAKLGPFMAKQGEQTVYQIIKFNLVINGIYTLLSFLIFLVFVFLAFKYYKKYKKEKIENEDESGKFLALSLISVFVSFFSFFSFIDFFYLFLKIVLAPNLFLLEYIKTIL